ncbi:MAG: iron ABC transporter permease [Vulcanimicrobiota bacterium]
MKRQFVFRFVGVLSLLALTLVLSLSFGATDALSPGAVVDQILTGQGVVYLFRLPRALTAMMVGLCFAISGLLLQSLTRNPLASPDLLGVTAGGGLATVIAILVGGALAGSYITWIAFLGASVVAAIIWVLGRGASAQRFILTGVALSALAHAVITLLLVTYAPSAAEAMIWLKGSLFGRGWVHVKLLLPWVGFVCLGGVAVAYQANPLILGPTVATTLGIRLSVLRPCLWLLSVAGAAAAVAVSGTIGFVGLIVPHVARRLAGPDLRVSIPFSGLLGAFFVLLADTVGRVLSPPLEIPAGLICAFLGAPYFGYLLVKGKTDI